MVHKTWVVLLGMVLLPAVALAQRAGGGRMGGGGGHMGGAAGQRMAVSQSGVVFGVGVGGGHGAHGRGFGVGTGIPTGGFGRGLAPVTGFGSINHPGLGYAPNTPGIGYPIAPGMQPLPLVTQPLPIGPIRPGASGFGPPVGYGYGYGYGYGHVHGAGCGHAGFGSVIAVPVPYPVAIGGGLIYSSGSYGWGSMVSQPPTVIIIQQPPAQTVEAEDPDRPRQSPRTYRAPREERRDEREEADRATPIYESRAPAREEKPTRPLTLLVFKDHSIYAVTEYWKEGDRIHFVTSFGTEQNAKLDSLDVEFTKRLNEERNVKFELR